ncbi:MAG: hypothetical protein WCG87_05735 [Bacteroidota bacterium]
MKKIFLACIALVSLSCLLMSYDIPKGWIRAGSSPESYDMGTDPGSGMKGGNAATIKSTEPHIKGFGTLMQNFDATEYRGKRIRLSGYVKAKEVKLWAGLWLRIDGKDYDGKRKTTAFDNMFNRAIIGTKDWTKCEIVLDVSQDATNIAFGALMDGNGQIWFDGLKIEEVSKDVPTTASGNIDSTGKSKRPTNLDFKE